MRLRYWTALTAILCVGLVVFVRSGGEDLDTVTSLDVALLPPQDSPQTITESEADRQTSGIVVETDQAADIAEHGVTFSRTVAPGESLDALLAEAGLDAPTRNTVAAAIGSEYDLQSLKPGHSLDLAVAPDGIPRAATLEIDDGVRIRAVFGDAPSVRVIPPALDTIHRAGAAEIGSSIYAALEAAGIPTRFATDLELVLAGTLDLRRAVGGGEQLRVMWRENRLGDRVIGEPMIDFAELQLVGGETYEILWPEDDSITTRIYKDGALLLSFEQPIKGARLSSSFGPRTHPVHGNVRMHSGVDFAAEEGSAVHAMRPGRIAFVGRRGGYGLMVEITHTDDIRTVYAHLSSVKEPLEAGQPIATGDRIGRVGSTGTSTGPHLHYEVVVDDRPVPPLTDGILPAVAGKPPVSKDEDGQMSSVRNKIARMLAAKSSTSFRVGE